MWSPEELALLEEFLPLIDSELRRIGVTEEDQGWIHAGSDQLPTRELLDNELQSLRALPKGLGVRGYCTWLGFDYDARKRELQIP